MGLIFVEGHINGKLAHKITVMHAWVHFHVNFDPRKFKSCLMVFTEFKARTIFYGFSRLELLNVEISVLLPPYS